MNPAFVVLGVLALSCSKPDAPPRRTEPWLANPSASGARLPSAPRSYRLTQESQIRFAVPGKRARVSGRFALGQGSLQLDLQELKNSRASLDVDLTTLSIETAQPEGLELGADTHSVGLQWLELGARVPSDRRAQFATAHFELASIEGPRSLALGAGRKATPTRATVVGTLLLHGFRAPLRVEVALSELSSERLSIRSASPLIVDLSAHDIMARDSSGLVDALATARSADWVGKSARVEFELVAELEPKSNDRLP